MTVARSKAEIEAFNRRMTRFGKVVGTIALLLLAVIFAAGVWAFFHHTAQRTEMVRVHDVNVLAASLVTIADDPSITRSVPELLRNDVVVEVLSREAVAVLKVTGLRHGLCTRLGTVVREDRRLYAASINGRVRASGSELLADVCKRDGNFQGISNPSSGKNEVEFIVR